MRLNEEGESVVVVPSVTIDRVGERSGSLTQAYEETIPLPATSSPPAAAAHGLRDVACRSRPPSSSTTWRCCPASFRATPGSRLSLVAVNDSSPRPLSEKLLERPRLLRQIAALIPDRSRSHLVPYNTTPMERDVALALGIPMYGADPRLFELGTKTGCRRLFAEEGVRHPIGFEDLHTFDELLDATVRLRAARPTASSVIVKLNEGVSGEGNAVVDLGDLRPPGSSTERDEVAARLRAMSFELPGTPLDSYVEKLTERGGIVEERISGVELRSPSVQLRVTPRGEVELLSTHDQLLGGPAARATWGACSRPTSRTPGRSARTPPPLERGSLARVCSAGSPSTSSS